MVLGDHGLPPTAVQNVTATAGFAYGVIGADIHVLGDGTPLYVLENYRGPPQADPDWLRELPSRMLNARYAVVSFTGRENELAQLRGWRLAGPRLAARWLYATGGQGKTRLAAQFAHESAMAQWKIVTATHGPGTMLPPPGSQDMRLGDARGILAIIDYADRWPLTHLTWLFSNALFHQSAPTRILLLARTAYSWPAVRSILENHQAGTSQQLLGPLTDESGLRKSMFAAARDSFAASYEIDDPGVIAPPGRLEQAEWALTLALHMAALVAVDAHMYGRRRPQDMAGLTDYLLDRERQHWIRLYENREKGLDYQTPPDVMSRAVFAAALTGPVEHSAGKAILDNLDLELHPERVLADHTVCYPPADPARATVLEPLYPDRLAEDFLALTLPGHTTDRPVYAWAPATAAALLIRRADHSPPAHITRAITFLAAAADRWPHLGQYYLYPLLRHDPQLAVAAGSGALTTLAIVSDIDMDVLEAIEALLPDDRSVDLDIGIAAVTHRLTDYWLTNTTDPADRAWLQHRLGLRLVYAGKFDEALRVTTEAVEIYRQLRLAEPDTHDSGLAASLVNLGLALASLGRPEEALAATAEAVGILRPTVNRGDFTPQLAAAVDNCGVWLSALGRWKEALTATEEAVALYRPLAAANADVYEPDLAMALSNLGNRLSKLGQLEEALAATEESAQIRRRLAKINPARFLPDFAASLDNLAARLNRRGRLSEALRFTNEAVDVYRRLATVNAAVYEPDLALAVQRLGEWLSKLGRDEEALASTGEAVDIFRQLCESRPVRFKRDLAMALRNLSHDLSELGRLEEASDATKEAMEILRPLASSNPNAFAQDLARTLLSHGNHLSALRRVQEGLAATEEAVHIFRRLAQGNHSWFKPDLAMALSHLGDMLPELGQREEALAPSQEAADLYRRLAEASSTDHLPHLVSRS